MKNKKAQERRRLKRRNIAYYLPILDNNTQMIIGHLLDISPSGLLMDSKIPIQISQVYNLRMDFMEDINGKASLEIVGRCKWCRLDPVLPNLYNAGFEINIRTPEDVDVVKRISEKYGSG